ncbi:hypothetical protein Tco_0619230 [Tanacetum coccineum]
MFQNILISLMDSIEKAIAERGLYKRVHDSGVNERTMHTHEEMRSKDAPEIDNNVARASHDKDNVTKAFKQDEDKYVNNIIQLEDKNKDLENIVCKMGKSSQTLRMLTNEQSLYQDNKRKMCLGYTYPCPLGQAIACHSKLYDAEDLGLHYVKPDVHDTKEILNDAEENPSTSNVSSESIKEMSDLPISKMPNENTQRRLISDNQNELREFYKTDVILMSVSLSKSSKELQQELTEESYVELKNKKEIERFSKELKDSDKFCNDVVEVKEKLSKQIIQLEKDFAELEAQSIAFKIALQHKNQENKSLKTLQKENENFMASLQIENAHLKQTYKDLF